MAPRSQGSARRCRLDFINRLASPMPRQHRQPLEKLTATADSRPLWASGGGRDSLAQSYKENFVNTQKKKKSQSEKAKDAEGARAEQEAKDTAEVADVMQRMLNTVTELLAVDECDGMQEQLEAYQVRISQQRHTTKRTRSLS